MISQRKIAETLGMPTSTVANILNGTPHYKKETQERVMKAAADLGYQRNRASQAIKRGRSNLIGVIHFGSPYMTAHQGIYFLVQALSEHSYDYLVVDAHWHSGDAKRVLNEIIQARVEGAVLIANTTTSLGPEAASMLKRAGIPVVSLYGEDSLDVPLVGGSSRASFFSMLRHLQRVGHRSVLLFVPSTGERSASARIEGFQMAMEGRGPCHILTDVEFFQEWPRLRKKHGGEAVGVVVRLDLSRYEDNILRASYELGKSLFASGALPDAIMCTNDRGACGIFNAAHEMNMRIPEDVAVTGADNEEIGSFPMFRLSSVRMDIASSARAAVEMLMKLLKKESLPQREVSFPSELILRQSCGRMIGPEGAEICVPAEQPPSPSSGA